MMVDLRSELRVIILSDSRSLRKFKTFSFDLPHLLARNEILTDN